MAQRKNKFFIALFICLLIAMGAGFFMAYQRPRPPYEKSKIIENIEWHLESHLSDADGSDLFPTTWAKDGEIYTSWGDGQGFEAKEKKSFGVSIIKGVPPSQTYHDIYYGPAGIEKGKIIDLISIDGTFYATFNMQDNPWPDVTYKIIKSNDGGKSWHEFPWKWPNGPKFFEPRRFLHYGQNYADAPDEYLYIYGRRVNEPEAFYLARVSVKEIENQNAYQYLSGYKTTIDPRWSPSQDEMFPIFRDENISEYKLNSFCVQYFKNLDRYLAVTSHGDAGEIGFFDAQAPWGPWTTVVYYEKWLGMSGGIFLSMSFPEKWMDQEDNEFWAVFSVHGYPSPKTYHDKLNIMKGRFKLFPK